MRLILEAQADAVNSPDFVPVFETDDELGGVIGSGAEADWVLPDRRRGVSEAHAAIGFIHQNFYIADTSAGGVFLNGSSAPIGAGRSEYIRSGDVLRIGPYTVRVRVEAQDAAPGWTGATAIPEDWSHAFAPAGPDPDDVQTRRAPDLPGPASGGGATLPEGFDPLAALAGPSVPKASPTAARAEPQRVRRLDVEAGATALPPDFDPLAGPSKTPPTPSREPVRGSLPADFDPLAPDPAPAALPADFDPLAPEPHAEPETGLASAPASGVLPADFDPLAAEPPEAREDGPRAPIPAGADFFSALAGTEPEPFVPPSARASGPASANDPGTDPGTSKAAAAAATAPPHALTETEPPPVLAMPLPGQRPRFGAELVPVPVVARANVRQDGSALAPAPPRPSVETGPAESAESVWAVLGIEPPEDPLVRREAVETIARALAAQADGLAAVLTARAHLKDEFRLTRTRVAAQENNAFKLAGSGREALEMLLPTPRPGFLPFDRAVEEGFLDVAAHEVATMVGMRAAFTGLLKRFQPDNLKARFGDGGKSLFGRGGTEKARCWDAFVAYYAELVDGADDVFNSVFGEAFERAYEDQIALLKQQGDP